MAGRAATSRYSSSSSSSDDPSSSGSSISRSSSSISWSSLPDDISGAEQVVDEIEQPIYCPPVRDHPPRSLPVRSVSSGAARRVAEGIQVARVSDLVSRCMGPDLETSIAGIDPIPSRSTGVGPSRVDVDGAIR